MLKVKLSDEDIAFLNKLFREAFTFEFQERLAQTEQILLGNLAYKLGVFVG